jgi:hypothetical protein
MAVPELLVSGCRIGSREVCLLQRKMDDVPSFNG